MTSQPSHDQEQVDDAHLHGRHTAGSGDVDGLPDGVTVTPDDYAVPAKPRLVEEAEHAADVAATDDHDLNGIAAVVVPGVAADAIIGQGTADRPLTDDEPDADRRP